MNNAPVAPPLRARAATVLTGLVLSLTLVALSAPAAQAATCGTAGWCSGSDGATGTNIQGNAPQIYIGEIGTYGDDFYNDSGPCTFLKSSDNPKGVCFSFTGASGADARATQSPPTGLGTIFFYFGGGSGANPHKKTWSSFCWGWQQGAAAVADLSRYGDTFVDYTSQWAIAFDVEQATGTDYGWTSGAYAANRDVFNGFYDYLAGTSTSCGTNTGVKWQPFAYSSKTDWNHAFGTGSYASIPNTPEWTAYYVSSASNKCWPHGFTNTACGSAVWFDSSNYHWAWQYSGSPDWDVFKEPAYLPLFGYKWGS